PRLALPTSWEAYLQGLTKKDRHELRRKLRRLFESGRVTYELRPADGVEPGDIVDFVRLHRQSAEAKAEFMTPAMEHFFEALLRSFSPRGWTRLYFLVIDGVRVAATMLFDYGGDYLLYNSGYDPAYAGVSAGLLLKAFC